MASVTAEATGARPGWNLSAGDSLDAGRVIIASLGTGRKSEVYLAWDAARRSTVAAKLIRPDRAISMLEREAGLLERLRHPLLVRGLDAALEGPRPHLVLEHVEGPSVRDLLRDGPLPAHVVAAVGHQMASLLHYLAAEGFVHLDVKAQNVLLASHSGARYREAGRRRALAGARKASRARLDEPARELPVAKLIDAGAIKAVGGSTKGSASDVPEHREGPTEVAAPAGVWVLGATLWHALGGEKHRPGSEAPAGQPGAEGVLEVASACLRDDPAARPSAEEVAVALEPLLDAPRRRRRPRRRLGRRA